MPEKIPQFVQQEKPIKDKKENFSYWAILESGDKGASIGEINQRKKALERIQTQGWENFEDFEIHGITIDSIAKGSRERKTWPEHYSISGLSEPKKIETMDGQIDLSGPVFGISPQKYNWQAILEEESLKPGHTFFTLQLALLDEKKDWATRSNGEEIIRQIEKNIKKQGLDVNFPHARSLGQAALRRALPEIFKEIKKYIWEKCYPQAAIDPNVANLEFKMDTEISQEIDEITEEQIIAGLKNHQFDEKIFYQGEGAEKYLQILRGQEYKLANVELLLIRENIKELSQEVADKTIVDLGAANALKAAPLLEKQLESQDQVDYVPVDINPAMVFAAAAEINNPQVNIQGKIIDFSQPLKDKLPASPKMMCLMGSTLGNGDQSWQQELLANIAKAMNKQDGLMIGINLKTDLQETLANYDNPQGREFVMTTVKNLGFSEDKVELEMAVDEKNNQIQQIVHIKEDLTIKRGEQEISYKKGEKLTILISQKYEVGELEKLANNAGLAIKKSFLDSKKQWELAVLQKK